MQIQTNSEPALVFRMLTLELTLVVLGMVEQRPPL